MYCKAMVRIYKDNEDDGIGFGKGIVMLLERVERFGSINKATQDMGMAYSKAWRILKATEAEFDVELVTRDGAHGSYLTEEAKRLMDIYYKLRERASAAVQSVIEGQD